MAALSYFSNRFYGTQLQSNQTHNQDPNFLTFPPTQIRIPSNNNSHLNNLSLSESFIEPIIPIEPSYQYYNNYEPSPLFTPSNGCINTSSSSYYLNSNSPPYNYFYEPSLIHSDPNPIYPKKQRYYYEPGLIEGDGFIPNPPVFFPEFVKEEEISSAVVVGSEYNDSKRKNSKNNNNGGVENYVSAQSIAARLRRKKISEKTMELGKLIPGGQRMNTAEMFHAAFKHIKFLQAQLAILELMDSLHQEMMKGEEEEDDDDEEEGWDRREMAVTVTCPKIQEKLHLKEICVVPKQVLKSLVNHPQLIKSNVASLLDEFILTLDC